jgi:uncharacterized protein YndB with AHSA1/START domain
MTNTDTYLTTPDREIVTIRTVIAPVKIVFKAWTDPEHLKKWWGPGGFTNTFHEFDLRPGGKWIFTMHGPDKGNYANECEFTEIIPLKLISWKRHSKPLFRIVVSFQLLSPHSTRVIFRMLFDSAEDCNKLKTFAPEKNEENMDRLEDELKTMQSNPSA